MFVILIRMIHMERKERQLKRPTFLYQRETRVKYPLESYIFTKKKKVDKKQNKINKTKANSYFQRGLEDHRLSSRFCSPYAGSLSLGQQRFQQL